MVRKTAISAIHSQYPELKNNHADLMSHSIQIAMRFYRMADREKTSVTAAQQLSEIMTSDQPNTSNEDIITETIGNGNTITAEIVEDKLDRMYNGIS